MVCGLAWLSRTPELGPSRGLFKLRLREPSMDVMLEEEDRDRDRRVMPAAGTVKWERDMRICLFPFSVEPGGLQVKRKNKHHERGNQTENLIIDNHKFILCLPTKSINVHTEANVDLPQSAKTHTSKTKCIPSKKCGK